MTRLLVLLAGLLSIPLAAQTSPTRPWNVSLGAGLAMTNGNTDSQSINLSFDALYDPKAGRLFKSELLYLRGESEGRRLVDKSSALLRYEQKRGERTFWFSELSYLRDPLKNIVYLAAPLLGGGVHLWQAEQRKLTVDGALGGTVENSPPKRVQTDLALKAGESLEWRLSSQSRLTQRLSGLWKVSDWDDAYYHFDAGLVTRIARRAELKLSYLYDYKNRPPLAAIKKGDSALFAALLLRWSEQGDDQPGHR